MIYCIGSRCRPKIVRSILSDVIEILYTCLVNIVILKKRGKVVIMSWISFVKYHMPHKVTDRNDPITDAYTGHMRNRTRCEKIKGEVSVAIEVVIRFDRHQL
jgi:hypothetical protein